MPFTVTCKDCNESRTFEVLTDSVDTSCWNCKKIIYKKTADSIYQLVQDETPIKEIADKIQLSIDKTEWYLRTLGMNLKVHEKKPGKWSKFPCIIECNCIYC